MGRHADGLGQFRIAVGAEDEHAGDDGNVFQAMDCSVGCGGLFGVRGGGSGGGGRQRLPRSGRSGELAGGALRVGLLTADDARCGVEEFCTEALPSPARVPRAAVPPTTDSNVASVVTPLFIAPRYNR
ncbi:hypothetical protein [Streptomyces sp. NPDC056227]|uniref:hypothetical protein n=1 Tax=Streptomyces sp. NPDC056227 TaxID=3345753 RepID=UPI0035D6838B